MLKLAGVVFLVLSTVKSQCFYKDDSSKKLDPEARTNLYRGQLTFTLNLFNSINEAVPDDNIFFSPFSVYHALLLAYFSAGEQTEQSLRRSLQIGENTDKVNLMTAYKVDKRSRATNNNSDSYEFTSANKLFTANELRVRQTTGKILRQRGNTSTTGFPKLLKTTSRTCYLKTESRKPRSWCLPMRLTLRECGLRSSLQSERRRNLVNEDLGAQILELPYKGEDISMYILLPPYSMKEGVTNIIAKLTPERLAAVVEEGYMGRDMVLEKLGVGDLFNVSANFNTLTDQPGIQFDDAPTRFIANFPFVYIIYERPTSSVLFMGVYRDPKK
ncbi:Uncharacterized protein OBRU01_03503 [Operophtera brumata]|uniref:Serpin domain-containing protein n=1 Tax=Operophtera brumata TaxID=104452 RepID=A0A0L7LQL0_OPEBR|nr:Uncharacterized protein OBRU01_03503 [Operophtera brumata]